VHTAVDYSLSSAELAQFERDGFIGPFDLYSPEEMEANLRALRPKLLNLKNSVYAGNKTVSVVSNYDRHLDIEFLARHVTSPQVVDRINSVLGPDTLCWRSEFVAKYPGDEGTDWHQVEDFSGLTEARLPQIQWPADSGQRGTLTVWAAFTESTMENGCLQFIPGSHRTMNYDETKGMKYDANQINNVEKDGTRRGFYGYNFQELQKDPNWRPDESKAVPQVMRQGQFIMFWSTVMHASFPNISADQSRLGYSVRYLPTSARVYPGLTELKEFGTTIDLRNFACVLTSGTDTYHHNRYAEQTVNGYRFPTAETERTA
jgi:non-heme Fe2+,alpha-ketoglutarate-dependent halogenase